MFWLPYLFHNEPAKAVWDKYERPPCFRLPSRQHRGLEQKMDLTPVSRIDERLSSKAFARLSVVLFQSPLLIFVLYP